MEININSDAMVVHTNKLEKLSHSAMPNAVRGTLNSLAFDVKKNTILKSSEKEFTNRKKNFFKASSRVEMARGFNLNSMESKFGFIPFPKNEQAVKDLEQQEFGGKIKNRDFIPMDESRVTKSPKRMVSSKHRLGKIKNIVKTSETKGKTKGQKFVISVLKAGKGGYVLHNDTLFLVKNIKKGNEFKLVPVYSYKKGRTVNVKATRFVRKAVKITRKKTNDIYISEAERQFKRYFKI